MKVEAAAALLSEEGCCTIFFNKAANQGFPICSF